MKPLYHDEWIGFLGIFVSPETPNMSETGQFHGNSGVNFPKENQSIDMILMLCVKIVGYW